MLNYKKLFDCLSTEHVAPIAEMLAGKVDGAYQPLSSQQVKIEVDELTNGLIHLGIQIKDDILEQDKIGIISNSRPEWIIADLAIQQSGAILVPLYPTTNIEDVVLIFNETEIKYCFVHDNKTFQKLSEVQSQIPSLKQIFTFSEVEGAKHWTTIKRKPTTAELEEIERRKNSVKEDSIATIIYTSGTTGNPKGVMLSQKNIVSNIKSVDDVIEEIGIKGTRVLSFLPLNHIFEKTVSYVYLFKGLSIYYAESMDTIAANIKEVKPSFFVTVPRLLEKVYEKIMTTGSSLTGIKKKLFFWAVALGNDYSVNKTNPFYTAQLALANKIIFNKWREALGGNVKAIVVGGAACPPKLARIFSAAQLTIMEGYGLTESSPVIAANRYGKSNRKIGTIGTIVDGVEVKLAEDGELLCKGDNVMVGYYKNPEETAKTIVDGWLHTGDIAQVVDKHFYKITDRKKELFKNSGGKYIAPQPIENKLRESRFIEQAMVMGANEKYVGALIVPNFENLEKWISLNGFSFRTIQDALNSPEVYKYYKGIINQLNKDLEGIETIKKFKLISREFSIELGELTPKLSLKRKFIMEHFQKEISEIFSR